MLAAVDIKVAKLAVDDASGVKVDINDGAVTVPCDGLVVDPLIPLNKPTGFEMLDELARLLLGATLDSR